MTRNVKDWIFRFIKGIFIGTGAILPGVSGGALAAVFGIYERIISFLAHLNREFKKNFLYLLPVGIGGVFGIFLLSFALSFLMEKSETQLIWFFIGCIIGILPSLYHEAGKQGRSSKHIFLMVLTGIAALVLLFNMENMIRTSMPQNFLTWMMAGGIFALGMIIPGLSPSNFLLYLDMYKPMVDGIKDLNLNILLPVVIGALLIVLLLSKLFDYIFKKAYAVMFHIILGIVLASTVLIIPWNFNYLSIGTLWCAIACVLGIILGAWMSNLEKKYKPEL